MRDQVAGGDSSIPPQQIEDFLGRQTDVATADLERSRDKSKRVRRPSIATIARQLLTAARAAGVNDSLTVDGGKATATPIVGEAADELNEWDAEFGTHQAQTRK